MGLARKLDTTSICSVTIILALAGTFIVKRTDSLATDKNNGKIKAHIASTYPHFFTPQFETQMGIVRALQTQTKSSWHTRTQPRKAT